MDPTTLSGEKCSKIEYCPWLVELGDTPQGRTIRVGKGRIAHGLQS